MRVDDGWNVSSTSGAFTMCRVADLVWITVATPAVPAGWITKCRVAGCNWKKLTTLAVPAGVFT